MNHYIKKLRILILICNIALGTFQERPPTELQISQIIVLVDYAIAEKKLSECYAVTVQPEPESKITFLTAVAEVLQKHALCDKN